MRLQIALLPMLLTLVLLGETCWWEQWLRSATSGDPPQLDLQHLVRHIVAHGYAHEDPSGSPPLATAH
jgi:hypothetical protein